MFEKCKRLVKNEWKTMILMNSPSDPANALFVAYRLPRYIPSQIEINILLKIEIQWTFNGIIPKIWYWKRSNYFKL